MKRKVITASALAALAFALPAGSAFADAPPCEPGDPGCETVDDPSKNNPKFTETPARQRRREGDRKHVHGERIAGRRSKSASGSMARPCGGQYVRGSSTGALRAPVVVSRGARMPCEQGQLRVMGGEEGKKPFSCRFVTKSQPAAPCGQPERKTNSRTNAGAARRLRQVETQ